MTTSLNKEGYKIEEDKFEIDQYEPFIKLVKLQFVVVSDNEVSGSDTFSSASFPSSIDSQRSYSSPESNNNR